MIKNKKSKYIASNDLLTLGFQSVIDDYIPTDHFYALAFPDFTFVTNSINDENIYAVYLIGYGANVTDVNLPITDLETLTKLIPIYIQKSLGKLKY